MFDVCAGERGGFFPPCIGRDVEIFGANEITDAATFVGFSHASPEAVEFLREWAGFVVQNSGARDEIEDGAGGSSDWGIELPARENVDASGADGGFDNLFVAAEAGVDCAQEMLAYRRFGEREQQSFIYRIRRALRSGIEFADGFGFVAEKLDAEWAVGFGGVDVENAAANGVLAGHFDYIC